MSPVITVVLPEWPKEKEFEDFIAAHFQSSGFFIEKNIIERAEEELFELDVSITDYDILPRPRLIEIKSGDWHFKDVFKVKGWMVYTSISKGYFIVQKGRQNFDFYRNKAKEIGIQLISVPEISKTFHYLRKPLKHKPIQIEDVNTFRYAYWLEREFVRLINVKKKSNKSIKRYTVLEEYQFNINSNTFFTNNLLDKTQKLYSNYINCPNLSAKCGHEILGEDFNVEYSTIPQSIFNRTFYDCEFNDIQISTYLEHQARLRILKCAVDYLMLKEAKNRRADDKDTMFGINISKFTFLPDSFKGAIEQIGSHTHYKKYPVFWQWFFYAFGGFVILDKREQEYRLLSMKTGIPDGEIDNALSAFDILFPITNGWFNINSQSNIRELKVFSVPFKGMGAIYRRLNYCRDENGSIGEYSKLGLGNRYALNDLIKWNNLLVNVLHNSI